MANVSWLLSTVLAYGAGAALSFVQELLLKPRPTWRKRPFAAWSLHLGVWSAAFGCGLLLVQRPVCAAFALLAAQLVILLVSNAKFAALREPFIFQDFEYFVDAMRHPRLYLPFLGLYRFLIAIFSVLVVAYVGLVAEPPIASGVAWPAWIAPGLTFVALGTILIRSAASRAIPLELIPARDLVALGFVTSLWRYYQEETRVPGPGELSQHFAIRRPAQGEIWPDLVVVQCESFFDVRPLFEGIDAGVLENYDALRGTSVQWGRLGVDCWGANTIRTEFSFLSALDATKMGVHQFQPYRRLAWSGIQTIASELKKIGYRTVCIHPYHASFYQRDRVFPLMGFDEFIDEGEFAASDKSGPFIGDVAVALKAKQLLAASTEPLFLFMITMENHGPLHLEAATSADVERDFRTQLPDDCKDLAVYVRHLRNADRMLGILRETLTRHPRPAWLCLYGDHVPIMERVYTRFGAPDGATDYIIWGNRQHGVPPRRQDRRIADLSGDFLDASFAAGDAAD